MSTISYVSGRRAVSKETVVVDIREAVLLLLLVHAKASCFWDRGDDRTLGVGTGGGGGRRAGWDCGGGTGLRVTDWTRLGIEIGGGDLDDFRLSTPSGFRRDG